MLVFGERRITENVVKKKTLVRKVMIILPVN